MNNLRKEYANNFKQNFQERIKVYFSKLTTRDAIRLARYNELSILDDGNVHNLSNEMINVICGRKKTKDGNLFRQCLKKQTNHISGLRSKGYIVDTSNIKKYMKNYENDLEKNKNYHEFKLKQEHENELLTGKFIYLNNTIDKRLHHNINNYKGKRKFLASFGYIHNYDIESCSLNIIKQYALKFDNTIKTPIIDYYLTDKDYIKNNLSQQFGITEKQIKQIFIAILSGSKFLKKKTVNRIFYLNENFYSNKRIISNLKNNEFVSKYIKECNLLWKCIEKNFTTDKNNKLSSSKKWVDIYFKIESDVRNSFIEYLNENNYKYFIEHDGFCCQDKIDTKSLSNYIQKKTGFCLTFSYEYVIN